MGSPSILHNILSLAAVTFLVVLRNGAIGLGRNAVINTSCDFRAIFNFGDSNSDTGGLYSSFPPQLPPYGETFFHRPTGRASDGRLIIDFIAEGLGLPYLHAYLNSTTPNFSTGVNFATGGSTINAPLGNVLPTGSFSPFSLDVQRAQFSHFKSNSYFFDHQALFKPEEEFYSQALYTTDIGQNDIYGGLLRNMSIEEIKASVPQMIDTVTENVKSLYKQGGRSFWIHNTGPIGCLPGVLSQMPVASSQIDSAGCAIPYNNVCLFFNGKLKEAISRLRYDLPLAVITYVDIYLAKYSLISNSLEYGFTKPLVACCGYGGKYNVNDKLLCGQTGNVDGIPLFAGSCNDPSIRISWDGIHYTEAANKWIYDQIKSGRFSDPPLSLKMACMNKLIQLY